MQPFDRGYLAIGVFVGGIAATAIFLWLEWFGFALSIGNQYFPAILGALVGGSIAIIGQLITIQHSVQEKAKEADTKNNAILLSLWEKVKEIESVLLNFKNHLVECEKDAEKNDVQLCIAVIPLSWHGTQVRFSPEEKALLLLWKEYLLYNQLSNLDLLAIGNIKHFAKYEEGREVLMKLGTLSADNGKIEFIHKPENAEEISGRLSVLDDSLRKFSEHLNIDLDKIDTALEMLAELIKYRIDNNLIIIAGDAKLKSLDG